MTPATQRDADEPKDCRRTAAAPAVALHGTGSQGAFAPHGRTLRTMGIQSQTCHQVAGRQNRLGRRPRRTQRASAEVEEVLWRIWKVSEQPCGKRLQALLPQWLPHYEGEYGRLVESRGHTNCLGETRGQCSFSFRYRLQVSFASAEAPRLVCAVEMGRNR